MTVGLSGRQPLRYLALGDSYTIGTSVEVAERWPNQLVARVADEARFAGASGMGLELVGNPAVNGFTTRDVIAVELPLVSHLRPEMVSLLIGTNDVIQGVGDAEYRRNVATILDAAQTTAGSRVFGVTSPDFTVTPAGADYGDPIVRSAELQRRNALFAELLGDRGLPVADILDISLEAARDRSLVAADGLHPSGRQYARWVDRILLVVRGLLAD